MLKEGWGRGVVNVGIGGGEDAGMRSQREGRDDGVLPRGRGPCGWKGAVAGGGVWEGRHRGWLPWSGRTSSRALGVVSVGEAIKGWVVASTGGRVDRGVAVVWGSICGSSGGGGCHWGPARVGCSGVRVRVGRGGCRETWSRSRGPLEGPRRGLPSKEGRGAAMGANPGGGRVPGALQGPLLEGVVFLLCEQEVQGPSVGRGREAASVGLLG